MDNEIINTSQYTHRQTLVYRAFCGCKNKPTLHYNGICQWCGNGATQEINSESVIKLDRKGQVVTTS